MNKDQKKEATQKEKNFIKCLDDSNKEVSKSFHDNLSYLLIHHAYDARQRAAMEADKVLVLSNLGLHADVLRELRINLQLSIVGQHREDNLPYGGAYLEMFYGGL